MAMTVRSPLVSKISIRRTSPPAPPITTLCTSSAICGSAEQEMQAPVGPRALQLDPVVAAQRREVAGERAADALDERPDRRIVAEAELDPRLARGVLDHDRLAVDGETLVARHERALLEPERRGVGERTARLDRRLEERARLRLGEAHRARPVLGERRHQRLEGERRVGRPQRRRGENRHQNADRCDTHASKHNKLARPEDDVTPSYTRAACRPHRTAPSPTAARA